MECKIVEKEENFLLNININIDQLLDENIGLICRAILKRGRILTELSLLLSKDKDVTAKAIRIIRMSNNEADAAIKLEKQLGISRELSNYIINMPLSTLASIDSTTANEMLKEYQDSLCNIKLKSSNNV